MKSPYFLIILFVIINTSCKNEEKTIDKSDRKVVLKGCVLERDSDTLLLVKSHEDARNDLIAKIPIVNYEFEYAFQSKRIEAYSLIFKEEIDKGNWRPIEFYTDNDTIQLQLHNSDNYYKNKIVGGKQNALNAVYKKEILIPYSVQLDSVHRVFDSVPYNTMYSDSYNAALKKLREVKTQEERIPIYNKIDELKKLKLDKNEFGKKIDSQVAAVQKVYWDKKFNFINKNPSIVSYSLLIEDIMSLEYNPAPKEKIIQALNKLQIKFPEHAYTELAKNLWIGYSDLKPSGQYINFTAPDINNVVYELKPFVQKNDIVLLDLWATWCGPCITRSRLMIPVYEEYKHKGFEIVGVAGEYKNLKAYKNFMDKEQWPWKNLIELDKQNKIWEKYNVMNGGGGMFLIDVTGEILAVDPTAKEVEAILKEKLNNQRIKL